MMRAFVLLQMAVLGLTLGCGSPITRVSQGASLEASPPSAVGFILGVEVRARPEGTSSVHLPAGSRWRPVGALPQGTAYRRSDGVLTLSARHQHEAYPVVAGDKLVGFYLPAKSSFVAVRTVLPLDTRKENS